MRGNEVTTQESAGTPTLVTQLSWPCGFWRRVGATFVDSLILGAVGLCLGLVWSDRFAGLEQNGRWIGFVIAGVYFIVLQARTGQSLGKMALGLKVMRLDGTAIDVRQATVRYLALGLPWILNGLFFTGNGVPAFLLVIAGIIVGVLVFSGVFGNLYLLIFNVPSRRLVHDWIAGTVMVRTDALPCIPEVSRLAVKRLHLAMVAGLVAAVFGVILWIWLALGAGFKGFEPLLAIQRQVNATPGVQSAQVTENWSRSSKSGRQRTLNIVICLTPTAHERRRAIALSAVAKAVNGWTYGETDAIAVQVVEGFDIGIASQWRKETESHTAAKWVEVLNKEGAIVHH